MRVSLADLWHLRGFHELKLKMLFAAGLIRRKFYKASPPPPSSPQQEAPELGKEMIRQIDSLFSPLLTLHHHLPPGRRERRKRRRTPSPSPPESQAKKARKRLAVAWDEVDNRRELRVDPSSHFLFPFLSSLSRSRRAAAKVREEEEEE